MSEIETSAGIDDHFRSVDSAPKGYSAVRPPAVVNSAGVVFVALALLGLTTAVTLGDHVATLATGDIVFATADAGPVRFPIRIFFVAFFITFAAHTHASWPRRLVLGQALVGSFLLATLAIDVGALAIADAGVDVALFQQQLLSGLVGLVVLPAVMLTSATLPMRPKGPIRPGVPLHAYTNAGLVIFVGIVAAAFLERIWLDRVDSLRSIALLGGLGPGLFLVQQAFTMVFAGVGAVAIRRSGRHDFAPPIAILIPAHNEAHGIADVIESIDRAAETYDGLVRVYVIDNASRDDTAVVAGAAIGRCGEIRGTVLSCPTPGKAIALNMGFDEIPEEFIVRIDADTVIGPNCLARAMRHFADPEVGAVGGLPLPAEHRTWIDRVRRVEVLLRHGYVQVALTGFGAILGLPGMFTVYRTSAIRTVGGVAEGMNGEDTDVVLRIRAAGYRILCDPTARYRSETPADFTHLREQRLRWFRSGYHIASYNRRLLGDPRVPSGAVSLPLTLANAARRAMLAPLIVYGAIVVFLFGHHYTLLSWAPVLALVVGMPFVTTAFVCLLYRDWRALLAIPEYLAFRVLRSWLTLESALTLVYEPYPRPPIEVRARAVTTTIDLTSAAQPGTARPQ